MLNVYNQIDPDFQTAYLSAVFAHRKPAVTTLLYNHISRTGNNIAMFRALLYRLQYCFVCMNDVQHWNNVRLIMVLYMFIPLKVSP